MEKEISRAVIKAAMLEILAECDQSFSDVLIKRVHPIVKQLVESEFKKHRDSLTLEIAIKLGQMMDSYPLWECSPEDLGLTADDLKQEYGRGRGC